MNERLNRLAKAKFSMRQVMGVHGEKPTLLQSWADKGWSQISPSSGPGATRELTLVDAYTVSIAVAFVNVGVNAKLANEIARSAVFIGHTWKRASERMWREEGTTAEQYFSANPTAPFRSPTLALEDLHEGFRERDPGSPFHLLARLGHINACLPLISSFVSPPPVEIVRFSDFPARELRIQLQAGALSDLGLFINLTDLLDNVDRLLLGEI